MINILLARSYVFINLFLITLVFISNKANHDCIFYKYFFILPIISIIDPSIPLNPDIYHDPIDVVYTWVNGSDPNWLYYFNKTKEENKISINSNNFQVRYIENDELRFSLRSLEKHAMNFIRYIFIVVANKDTQVPYWLNTSHPQIKIIPHKQIFPSKTNESDNAVFNFNSNAIENCLSNIPGLSNTFIYFNDDIFIGKSMIRQDFFTNSDKPRIIVKSNHINNIEYRYKVFAFKGQNDHAGPKFFAGLMYTLMQFKNKYKKLTPLSHLHVAYPTTIKIQKDYKKAFNEDVMETINSPFRRVNDLLMQFISFQNGMLNGDIEVVAANEDKAVFISDNFINNIQKINRIYNGKTKMFCINIDIPTQQPLIKAFLYILFPNRSSFESKNSELPDISEDSINQILSMIKAYQNRK